MLLSLCHSTHTIISKYNSGKNSQTSTFVNRVRREITAMNLPCRKNGQQNYTVLNIKERNVMGDQKHDSLARYWMKSTIKKNK
jgi:hypothetical protein